MIRVRGIFGLAASQSHPPANFMKTKGRQRLSDQNSRILRRSSRNCTRHGTESPNRHTSDHLHPQTLFVRILAEASTIKCPCTKEEAAYSGHGCTKRQGFCLTLISMMTNELACGCYPFRGSDFPLSSHECRFLVRQ